MAKDDLRERESEYLKAARLVAEVETMFSEEFLLAKTRDVTDKVAEHMAVTRMGKQLAEARALELIARKRLECQ